jgi:altronate dehydratase
VSPVPALVISARDNVATALEPLEAGQTIVISGQSVTVVEPTPRGHKIALRLIRQGEQVVKYGSTIGTATHDIQPGAHVHTHNVASSRGRGDLHTTAAEEPRIAEPPDLSPVTGKTVQ